MITINLRDLYPYYYEDCFVEVSDEVAEKIKQMDRQEAAYRRKTYRHKAYFSLDRDDGIENEMLFVTHTPHEIYEQKITYEQLHAAISKLSDKQGKRIYAYYFLGMNLKAIACAEGVRCYAVSQSIQRGLKHMEQLLLENI